jgi:two-component system CheB/CheR fusion protein
MWGLRSDEVLGRSFYDIDIGLPADKLREMIRSVLAGGGAHQQLSVDAMTRRGKRIRCRVKAHVVADGEQPKAVVLVMEETNSEAKT